MDLKQIENILAIANKGSITKAAEGLFVTQSALNQQLLKLEKEIGLPLFERRNHSMIPTDAGQIYLDGAREILQIKENTYKRLSDMSEDSHGTISIVYTPERGPICSRRCFRCFTCSIRIYVSIHGSSEISRWSSCLRIRRRTWPALPMWKGRKSRLLLYRRCEGGDCLGHAGLPSPGLSCGRKQCRTAAGAGSSISEGHGFCAGGTGD